MSRETTTVDEPQPEPQLPPLESDEGGYEVTLPTFQGPLDLLLHLIRKHELDIYDIPILLITEQYNRYLDAMQELDLEVAADYIYMAALLINIKSRMLLPRDESQDGDDPRAELVDRLVEYQRFKGVAESFAEIDLVRIGVWSRDPSPTPGVEAREIDMSEVSLFDLIDAFRDALKRYRYEHPKSIELQRLVHKVSDKMRELWGELTKRSPIRLLWYLEGRDRGELIAIFLATLELIKLGGLSVLQSGSFGEILIHRTEKPLHESEFRIYDD